MPSLWRRFSFGRKRLKCGITSAPSASTRIAASTTAFIATSMYAGTLRRSVSAATNGNDSCGYTFETIRESIAASQIRSFSNLTIEIPQPSAPRSGSCRSVHTPGRPSRRKSRNATSAAPTATGVALRPSSTGRVSRWSPKPLTQIPRNVFHLASAVRARSGPL